MDDRLEIKSYSAGQPCPKCTAPLTARDGSFFWRGEYRPAAFCQPCNSIWPMAGQEIPPLDPAQPRNDW